MAGKGDNPRPIADLARFNDNFDRIFKQGKYSEQKEAEPSVAEQAGRDSDSDESESPQDGS